MLQGEDLPVQSEWVIFVVVLALVGVFNLTLALLPRSWIAKACKKDRDDEQLFSVPLRLLGGFAATSYVLALAAYFVPHRWNLDPQLMLSLCPMYLVRMTIDPSPVAIFFLLAPMNAGRVRRTRHHLGIRPPGVSRAALRDIGDAITANGESRVILAGEGSSSFATDR